VLILIVLGLTIALNVVVIVRIPKGFFPQQDTGVVFGGLQGPQDASFPFMQYSVLQAVNVIRANKAVAHVNAYTGGGGASNGGFVFMALKPLGKGPGQRTASAMDVINQIRVKINALPIASVFLQPAQDIRIGGRGSNALYQYTIQSDNIPDLAKWGPILLQNMRKLPGLQDVNTDQQNGGLEELLTYDRVTAARLGQTPQTLDSSLSSAFGQSEVSVIYTQLNQYYVVMEVAPQYWQSPEILRKIYVRSPGGQAVPLSTFAHFTAATAPLSVNHQGLFPSVTISFNLQPGVALGDAVNAISVAASRVQLPPTITTMFSGTAQAYQDSLSNEPILIAAALATVYLMLGILYESYIHPVTILSTLPSAGVGALLALMLTRTDLSVIAMIGIILLIGLVEKNAILMIDFALSAQRQEDRNSRDAIFEACLLRFRPIMMTTTAAMLGAVPLALGTGVGSELRRPLGITIIGGLLVSQALTLFTTPVVYLYFDRLERWWTRLRAKGRPRHALTGEPAPAPLAKVN